MCGVIGLDCAIAQSVVVGCVGVPLVVADCVVAPLPAGVGVGGERE